MHQMQQKQQKNRRLEERRVRELRRLAERTARHLVRLDRRVGAGQNARVGRVLVLLVRIPRVGYNPVRGVSRSSNLGAGCSRAHIQASAHPPFGGQSGATEEQHETL